MADKTPDSTNYVQKKTWDEAMTDVRKQPKGDDKPKGDK